MDASSKSTGLGQVKKTIRALLISARNGLTPQQLLKDYETIIGEPLPFRDLGFNTLLDAIHGMPDVIRVDQTCYGYLLRGIPDKSSRHVAQMVSRQRNTKPYCSIVSSQQQQKKPQQNYRPYSSKEVPEPFKIKLRQLMISYPNGLPVQKFQEAFMRRFGYYANVTSWGFTNLQEALESVHDTVKMVRKKRNQTSECVLFLQSERSKRGEESLNSLEKSPIKKKFEDAKPPLPNKSLQELANKVCKLLDAHPEGLWGSKLLLEYKALFNQELPLSSLGYSSVMKLLHDLPGQLCDIIAVGGSGDWLVFRKGSHRHQAEHKHGPSQQVVADNLVKFLKQLICRQPNPVMIETLPLIYKGVTNKDIPFLEHGFLSLAEMLKHIPGISVIDTPEGRLITVKDQDHHPKDDKLPASPPKTHPSSYVCQKIPPGSKAFGVYVTYVKTPSCLCLQIIREDTTQALDSLHDDMAMYYNSRAGESCIIKSPAIGQPCCTRFNNDGYWYRGEVTGFPQLDTVEVWYVDYGNSAVVPKTSIQQPKAHYLALPAQAIHCRLANIRPAGPFWSKRASSLVFEMTKDKAIATIVTQTSKSCISVCLCDTTTQKDIHINDCLVAQGLAIFVPDTPDEEQAYDKYEVDPPPAESSKEDANIRLPTVPGSAELLCPGPEGLGQTTPTLSNPQQMMAQLMQLNTLMMQGLNIGNSANLLNPFLPFPMAPSVLSNDIVYPVSKPKTSVPPPPGFENPTNTKAQPVSSPDKQIYTNDTAKEKKVSGVSAAADEEESYKPTGISSNKIMDIKRVPLPSLPVQYTLHLLRYQDCPFVLSKEVSSWFWEADILHYHLKRNKKTLDVKLLHREDVPQLFEALVNSQCSLLWETLATNTIKLYSLVDIPEILGLFKAPEALFEAVRLTLEDWRKDPGKFWLEKKSPERITLEKKLAQLQQQRTDVLTTMTHDSSVNDTSIGMGGLFKRFLEVDKEIESIQNKLEGVDSDGEPPLDENKNEAEYPCTTDDDRSHVTKGHKVNHMTTRVDTLQFSEFSDSSESEGSPDDRDTPISTSLLSQPLPSPPPITSTPISFPGLGLLSQPMLPLPLPPPLHPIPFPPAYNLRHVPPVRTIAAPPPSYSPFIQSHSTVSRCGNPTHLLPMPGPGPLRPQQVFQGFHPRPHTVNQRPLLNFGGFKNVI